MQPTISTLMRIVLGAIAALVIITPALADNLVLFDGKTVASIVYAGSDGTAMSKAAALLSHDLSELTGRLPTVASSVSGGKGVAVVIGRADSPEIAAILKANAISTASIAGKWETYGRAAVPAPWNPKERVLVVFGSDTRGTIWGVIDLTRELGVSPWEWWADVKTRRVARIAVDATLRYSKEPSVKYRGIFLNDEDFGLHPWSAKTYDPKGGDIGPKTYARIFELMWRLKANTIWPAMHKITDPFNADPGNTEMAASYAIVRASSHAEPMLRSNEREWNEKTMGPFNWLTNKQNVLKYWDDVVNEKKQFENLYTVGLRGTGDSPMEGVETPQQTARVLEDVIAEQRKILEDRVGKPADRIPQVFTPYKEVLPAYDAGLKLPDDITITWPDDNYGYIRRLGNAQERARSGGSGVYYHISYWGSPMSYLWLATTHPALLWEEMDKAYRFEARRIWIVNVGDTKPGEYLTQLFLDMAFDDGAFPNIDSVRAHLKNWAAGSFGEEHAGEIADILWRYYDLAFARKPEFMGWNELYPNLPLHETAFNMLDFGDENARRVAAYQDIALQADKLTAQLPKDRRDAFFQLVRYPVDAAADFNERILDTDKAIAYGLQHRASANLYSARAGQAQARLLAATHTYNDVMSGGKWRNMMDIAPNRLPQFEPPVFPTWKGGGDTGCGVQAEGGGYYDAGGGLPVLPAFHRELGGSRYVDIFVKTPVAAAWTATAGAPWIKLSRTKGGLGPKNPEQRFLVSIDWAGAPEKGRSKITLTCGAAKKPIPVGVPIAPRSPPGVSFIEADRIVSMYAAHADTRSDGWEVLDGLGHAGASLRTRLDMASIDTADPAAILKAPAVTYRFATATADDPATLRAIALPMLPVTSANGMRIAVSVDGGAPKILDLSAAEFSATWRRNVLTNTAVGQIGNLRLAPGAHALTVYALDPGVTLDRLEVSFTGAQRAYGPVPETRIKP
ncbi:MAG: glycosyl hydrolase 115 family protein [Alphaproteobacteria bacterium]|nr:glycosyl hydrolase 115 family protein [Alphaproteobacteria bacterium]